MAAALEDETRNPGAAPNATVAPTDDAELRRSYAAVDMKLHACATAREDGTIVGSDCPSALVVFGPYVTVPSNSDVKLRFDIQAQSAFRLMSDVLSQGAKQFHGSLDDELIEPGDTRTISYRIHVFDAARALETRIGLRTDQPLDFTIRNLSLIVQ